jgi:hypothetical protein
MFCGFIRPYVLSVRGNLLLKYCPRYGKIMFLLHGVTPQNTLILIILPKECKLHEPNTFIFLILQFCNFLTLGSIYSPITLHGKSCYRSYGWERQYACKVRCGSGWSQPFPCSCAALQSNVAQIHQFPSYDSTRSLYAVRTGEQHIAMPLLTRNRINTENMEAYTRPQNRRKYTFQTAHAFSPTYHIIYSQFCRSHKQTILQQRVMLWYCTHVFVSF